MNKIRRVGMLAAGLAAAVLFAGAGTRLLASCSDFGLPFTDLGSETTFCAAIAEAYFSGLTNGTTATTYSPSTLVPRDQMAAFITRTLDQSLLRGNRRAALDQWWTPAPLFPSGLALTSVGMAPSRLACDGADVWVTNSEGGTVSRVRASDGKNLETWTGMTSPFGIIAAMGRVFVTGFGGHLYEIDPSQTAGAATTAANTLLAEASGIAFDGDRIWIAHQANPGGGISIVTPGSSTPWSVTTVTNGFTSPYGIVFDGTGMWVTDLAANTFLKLDSNAAIVQTVAVGHEPTYPAFDGHNFWVPNHNDDSLTVVRASDGAVLKTFSAGHGNQNGLSQPLQAVFDGQRILVLNSAGFSLFKAADLSVIGNSSPSGVSTPFGACSDGVNFWASFNASGKIGRF